MAILQRAGYDPAALVTMLEQMERRLAPGGADFARTHPAPRERLAEVTPLVTPRKPLHPTRQQRFFAALAGI